MTQEFFPPNTDLCNNLGIQVVCALICSKKTQFTQKDLVSETGPDIVSLKSHTQRLSLTGMSADLPLSWGFCQCSTKTFSKQKIRVNIVQCKLTINDGEAKMLTCPKSKKFIKCVAVMSQLQD